jgi:hypothetical protein
MTQEMLPHIRVDVLAAWHGLLNRMFDPYRPECHYMRGPGPKWRAKHKGQASP